MDDTKRRIEINVDRRRVILLKRRGGPVSGWCAGCGEQVAMLTADEAATLADVSSRTIYRRVEAGELHYAETSEGHLLVCANSIEAIRFAAVPPDVREVSDVPNGS